MQMLKRLRVVGWKSIKNQTVDFTPLTVVIGANGAGKSNLLSIFKLVDTMFREPTPAYVLSKTWRITESRLHYGSGETPAAEMEFTFGNDQGETSYFARWEEISGGELVFAQERVAFRETESSRPLTEDLGVGHMEPNLLRSADDGNAISKRALRLLRSCRLFHFHDTSEKSAARKPCYVEANHFLYPDAGNLAAMLYLFREQHPTAFRRITATVRQMVPDFDGFVLAPSELNKTQILLNWTHRGRDYEFGPHQLSDGSLRLIALATLLLQPEDKLPLLIALDEPELGLHPAALEVLAGMARSASRYTQVLFATQSSVLVDYFDAENVLVVHSRAGASEFERLNAEKLEAWRADYTLGEIWEKNVVGGGPYE